MRDTTNTIIEYDFSGTDTWRERVVTIGPCPGTPPDCIGPYPWRHERHACDASSVAEDENDDRVRIYCTCGFEGPIHRSESEAIEAFNASCGVPTLPITDWLVHARKPQSDALPF